MAGGLLVEKRVLVVEDEYFLAEDLCRELEGAGAVVVAAVPSIEQALGHLATDVRIDGAVLDVNLGGEAAYPVADALLARSVPFVFVTGYDDDVLNRRYPDVARCTKPAEFPAVARALAKAMAGPAAQRPAPGGSAA